MSLHNLAKVATATTGMGTITLGSAISGFNTFGLSGVTDGETVTYGISDGANSEVGRGVYTASGTTLTRATVLASTNGGAKINLSGTAQVYLTAAAEDIAPQYELGQIVRLPRQAQTISKFANTTRLNQLELMDGRTIAAPAALAAAVPAVVQPDFQMPHNACPITPLCSAWSPTLGLWVALGNSITGAISSDGLTWRPITLTVSTSWKAVIWAGTQFVAVSSTSGTIAAVSSDGVTWWPRVLPTSSTWQALAIGPSGQVLAISSASGTIAATSADNGNTWTARTLPATVTWQDVTWSSSLTLYVAVASAFPGNIGTSPDGITWTTRNCPAAQGLNSIDWNGTAFIASPNLNQGYVLRSTDGLTWSIVALPLIGVTGANGVLAHGTKFCMFCAQGNTLVSTDSGATWTVGTIAFTPLIMASNGTTILAQNNGPKCLTSTDGLTWGPSMPPFYNGQPPISHAYGGGTTVVVYGALAAGSLSTLVGVSTDNGATWAIHPALPQSLNWTYVAWSPSLSLFCAVAANSNIAATSADGLTWTQRTLPATQVWAYVGWVNDRYIITGRLGTNDLGLSVACYSTDGTTWTASTLSIQGGTGTTSGGVAWNGTVHCKVAPGSYCLTSTDGLSWTPRAMPYGTWTAIAWNGTVFCAVQNGGGAGSIYCATSPDGTTWTLRTMNVASIWCSIAWGGTTPVFCAIANASGTIAATSPDGITWTARTLSSTAWWSAITWSATLNLFAAIAGSGSTIGATSPDGITWTARTLPTAANWNAIAVGAAGLFCAVASGSTAACTSADGITWTARTLPASATWSSIAWNGSKFLATVTTSTTIASSADGITWLQGNFGYGQADSNANHAISVNGSTFVVTGPVSGVTTDGMTFTAYGAAYGANWGQVAYNGTTYVMVQTSTAQAFGVYATSTNGTSWTLRVLPFPTPVTGVAWNGTTFSMSTAIGPDFQSANGTTWTTPYPWLSSAGSGSFIKYVNGKFVAYATTPLVAYSSDGQNWNHSFLAVTSAGMQGQGIAWNGTVYCLVGSVSAYCWTSTDLVTWTQRTMPASDTWKAIAWNGTVFCAVSNASTAAATSPDGITWTARTMTTSSMVGLAWNGTVFCGVTSASAATAVTSPDGITWTNRTMINTNPHRAIAWNGSVFCVIFNAVVAYVETSPDGITWTSQSITSAVYNDISWNGTNFLIVQGASTTAYTSPTGVTWTARTMPAASSAFSNTLTAASTQFLVMNGGGVGSAANCVTSTDGTTWAALRGLNLTSTNQFGYVTWNGSLFYKFIVGSATTTAYTSPDGFVWTLRSLVSSLTWVNSDCVGAGSHFPFLSTTGILKFMTKDGSATDGSAQTILANNASHYWASVQTDGSDMVAVWGNIACTAMSKLSAKSTDGGLTWTYNLLPAIGSWSNISWNGSYYLAVSSGNNNTSIKSADGVTWTVSNGMPAATSAGTFKAVANNTTTTVAICSTSFVFVSSNAGATWVQYPLPTTLLCNNIIWNGTVFCIVQTGGSCLTSPDGKTWTIRLAPSSSSWTALAVGAAGLLVMATNAGDAKAASSSDNGVTWTARTMPSTATWTSMVWNGTVFCTVSNALSSAAATSPDGITWTARTLSSSNNWNSITWDGTTFCALGAMSGTTAATSPDGITWTARALPATATWTSVTANTSAGLLVAVASAALTIATSADHGATWTQRMAPGGDTPIWVSYNSTSNTYLMLGVGGLYHYKSSDGITWTPNVACGVSLLTGLCWSPKLSLWVAVCGGAATAVCWTSPDGLTWTRRTMPSSTAWNTVAWSPTAQGQGCFCALSATSGTVGATSVDGITWTTRTVASSAYSDVCWGNGLFVALNTGGGMYTSPDGLTWTNRPIAAMGTGAYFVAFTGSIFILAGGGQPQTSLDGINWTLTPSYPAYGLVLYDADFNSKGGVIVGNTNGLIAYSPPFLDLTPLPGAPTTIWGDYLVVA